MTPQSNFMILAPLQGDAESSLCALLASMNGDAGMAHPGNDLVPFGRFDRLHFARFVILKARTGDDISVYGIPPSAFPASLWFLGDCDGPADTLLSQLADIAGPGLRRVFAHCQGFPADADLLQWMKRHQVQPSARYVNWIGRTVQQIRENDLLRSALTSHWQVLRPESGGLSPQQICRELLKFVDSEREAGRLPLTAAKSTPLGWRLRNLAHLIGVPLVILAMTPFLVIFSPVLALRLRSLEKTDPEIVSRPSEDSVRSIAAVEDHDFTNQFSAFGDIKPGAFRRYTVIFLLWLLDYATRHIYHRGYLTGLTNYIAVISDGEFRTAAGNLAVFVVVSVPLELGIGFLVASLLRRRSSRARGRTETPAPSGAWPTRCR